MRGVHQEPGGRRLAARQDRLRRRRLLWRYDRTTCVTANARQYPRGLDRCRGRVQGRSPDPIAGRLRQNGRVVRRPWRVVRGGHPAVQYHHLDGPAHPERAAVVCTVRARSYRERIRDKVAASKRKGIWMGGSVPIGYDVRERKLLVNETEAKKVRQIFERYLEIGSVRLLKRDLDSRGIVSATRSSRKGNTRGGKPFSRGALYCLLSNPIYVGEIRHRNERHIGQHDAIVSRELWERVQHQLRSRAVRQGEGRKTAAPRSPLAGKLFDESGEPLYVQGAAKGQRRYRYYVSRRLVRGESKDAE